MERTPPEALTPSCGPTAPAHQRDVLCGGAAAAEAGGGLDEICAGLGRGFADHDLLLVGEQMRFR